jgi:phage gp36-like protein
MYATRQNIVDRYGAAALTVAADRDSDGAEDAGVVDQALTDASELIDSYLASKYTLPLPLPNAPAVLTQMAVDIAFYKLCQGAAALTDEIKDRNTQALRWLRDVADGRAALGEVPEPARIDAGVTVVSNDRQFTRGKLRGV